MGTYQVDLKSLMALSWGDYFTRLYQIPNGDLKAAEKTIVTIGDDTSGTMKFDKGDEKGEGTGLLGLPIFQKIKFKEKEFDTNGFELLDCLVSVNFTNTIIKTPVQGLDFTVKEFISAGDYQITIKGLIVGANPYKRPEVEIRQLVDWLRGKKQAFFMEGKIFEFLGINALVVEDVIMPQLPSYINIIPYEIQCLSDVVVSLIED